MFLFPATEVIITAVESEISARGVVSGISVSCSKALLVPEPSSLERTVMLSGEKPPQPIRLNIIKNVNTNDITLNTAQPFCLYIAHLQAQ